MITLREYQGDCVGGVRQAFREKFTAPLLVAPTGAGKTVMFGYMAHSTAAKGKKVLIMAHRTELCTQCGDKLMEYGVDFGYISGDFTPDYNQSVQVGTIQSIVSRMERLDSLGWYPDLIVIDECHRSLAPTYRKIIEHFGKALLLGVTATPVRGDGGSLGEIYDRMIIGPTVKELMDMGYLVKAKTYGPKKKLDLSRVKTTMGDYQKAALENVVDRPSVTGDAVDHYRRICGGVPAVVFCVSIKHAEHVAEEFRAAGYICESIDGKMSAEHRKDILERVKRGEIHILTSVDLVTEGFDAPVLQAAIMLRPTKSAGLFIQMAGRVLRLFDGKKWAYILDHAGLSLRHGFIDDDRAWTLDGSGSSAKGGGTKEKTIATKQCPECFMVHRPEPECPGCGHHYEIKSREIKIEDGVLIEITEEEKARIQRKQPNECKTLEDLKELGDARGYDKKWAYKIWDIRKAKALI